jgi:hypothetical protein
MWIGGVNFSCHDSKSSAKLHLHYCNSGSSNYTSSVRLRRPYASAMALDELFRSSLLMVNSEGFVPRRGLYIYISMALFSVHSSE